MATAPLAHRAWFFQSVIFKNILLFLLILLVAVVPLALRYYQDSRDYEIQTLAKQLEFFAERGASWVDVTAIPTLVQPEHMQTPAYRHLKRTLNRIEQEFNVDNAVIMRQAANGQYTYIAAGDGMSSTVQTGDGVIRNPCNPAVATGSVVENPCHPRVTGEAVFSIGQPVHIHAWFPETYKATNDTWLQGEMMHSQLFGGKVINESLPKTAIYLCRVFTGLNETRLWHRFCSPPGADYDFKQFLQINTPLKLDGKVVAILMLNKFAEPVAAAVRTKTLKVLGLTVGLLAVGLVLFGYASARMLRPLKNLTAFASQVAQGDLDMTIAPPRSRDEVGRLTATFSSMLEGLRQRDFIRDTFGRYLSREVVEELLGSPDGLRMGGELCEVTFLVSDLRGFTSMAAHLSPQDVIHILNRYLERMVDIIARYRGTVDEFQGDGILAFFGAPLAAADDPERAIACAIAMQTALVDINAEQRQHYLPELVMGIGINTGEVIVGNIGSEKRTKYGAVGSAINTAYRIESYTVGGQILMSSSTYEQVRSLVRVRNTLEVQFKGLDQPITLYDVTGLNGRYACALPDAEPEILTPLDLPLPITCFVVEGKTVSDQAIPGTITHLAAATAEVVLEGQVPLHANLKCVLTSPEAAGLPEAYVKVLDVNSPHGSTLAVPMRLGFTVLPEETDTFLERQRVRASQKERVRSS
jgi:class 3 adenylate cyclase